jgi:NAD(P)-dependent dehydrogenase (short-subunit alcohol dehydrogenase family)
MPDHGLPFQKESAMAKLYCLNLNRKENAMIVITGASGGLGRYLIEHLGTEYEIIGTFNTHEPTPTDRVVGFYQMDVTDSASVQRFATAVADKLKRIVLINLAGISQDGMGHKMSDIVWDRVMDTNLKGTFLMCRAMLPLMREQQWGRIINVSSIVGQMGVPGTVAYSTSKSGLFGLTRTLAAENATKNITVNALSLGYFDAGMINVIMPDIQEQIKAKIPMKRFGDPRNLEQAVRFLVESDYITGSIININGGLL